MNPDWNLFPQLRSLNRGWSKEGKLYREMETYVAANPGTMFFLSANPSGRFALPGTLGVWGAYARPERVVGNLFQPPQREGASLRTKGEGAHARTPCRSS